MASGISPESGSARYLRHVAIERGLSQNTLDAYRRDLEAYAAWLTGRGIGDLARVEPETLAEYVAELNGAPEIRTPIYGRSPGLPNASGVRLGVETPISGRSPALPNASAPNL